MNDFSQKGDMNASLDKWNIEDKKYLSAYKTEKVSISENKTGEDLKLDKEVEDLQYYYEKFNAGDKDPSVKPMLAQKYYDHKNKISFPFYTQPKLDGIRCVAKKNGLWTRNGNRHMGVPHIWNKIKHLFEENPDLVLDGELYTNKYKDNFNKISSLVKKKKPTKEDLKQTVKAMEYWVYDMESQENFSVRSEKLKKIVEKINKAKAEDKIPLLYLHSSQSAGKSSALEVNNVDKGKPDSFPVSPCFQSAEKIEALEENNVDDEKIVYVETHKVENQAELDGLYNKWLGEGLEGQMIRIDKPYDKKRSKYLLKRKEFVDEEFIIIGAIEGNGKRRGTVGKFEFETKEGEYFTANPKGDFEYISDLWERKEELIGKEATVKYFRLTPERKVPRFAHVIAIRDYE